MIRPNTHKWNLDLLHPLNVTWVSQHHFFTSPLERSTIFFNINTHPSCLKCKVNSCFRKGPLMHCSHIKQHDDNKAIGPIVTAAFCDKVAKNPITMQLGRPSVNYCYFWLRFLAARVTQARPDGNILCQSDKREGGHREWECLVIRYQNSVGSTHSLPPPRAKDFSFDRETKKILWL